MVLRLFAAAVLAATLSAPTLSQTPPKRKAPAVQSRFSLDTPIVQLLAHAQARAALTKVMPTLAASPHLKQFEHLSIRQLAANPHASIAGAKIRALQAELAKIK